MLHTEHATIHSNCLTLSVVLLQEDTCGERRRILFKGEGTQNLLKAEATKADICRSNLLQVFLNLSLRPYFTSFREISTGVSNPTCCGESIFSRMAFLQLQPNARTLLLQIPLTRHGTQFLLQSSISSYKLRKRKLHILCIMTLPVNIFIAQCLIPHFLSVSGLSWPNFPLSYSTQIKLLWWVELFWTHSRWARLCHQSHQAGWLV